MSMKYPEMSGVLGEESNMTIPTYVIEYNFLVHSEVSLDPWQVVSALNNWAKSENISPTAYSISSQGKNAVETRVTLLLSDTALKQLAPQDFPPGPSDLRVIAVKTNTAIWCRTADSETFIGSASKYLLEYFDREYQIPPTPNPQQLAAERAKRFYDTQSQEQLIPFTTSKDAVDLMFTVDLSDPATVEKIKNDIGIRNSLYTLESVTVDAREGQVTCKLKSKIPSLPDRDYTCTVAKSVYRSWPVIY